MMIINTRLQVFPLDFYISKSFLLITCKDFEDFFLGEVTSLVLLICDFQLNFLGKLNGTHCNWVSKPKPKPALR